MTEANRCACGRPVRDAYLCRSDTRNLRDGLRDLTALHRELIVTAYRLDRVALPGAGRGTGEKPLPWRPHVTALIRRTARTLAAARNTTADRIAKDNPRAAEWLDTVRGLCAEARVAVDLPQTHRYLGACDECGLAMYAPRAEDFYQCRCGRTYNVDRRVDALRRRAADVVASAATIATALTSLDQPVTEERIQKWRQRGLLTPRSLNGPRRAAWYRVGDVQALLESEARRRARSA